MNKALQLSCEKGLPVRVVRSHKVRLQGIAWLRCVLSRPQAIGPKP